MLPEWRINQVARFGDGGIEFTSVPPSQEPRLSEGSPLTQGLAAAQ
jgi:hypothetical protein